MTRLRLAILLTACAVWALAVFVRVELEAMARRAWHRIACAWMQCDEAPG
jgi:hypothetical protein